VSTLVGQRSSPRLIAVSILLQNSAFRVRRSATYAAKALKRELRATSDLGVVERAMVAAATELCRYAATARITPETMLAELRRALDLLQANISPCDQPPAPLRRRPIFCVIEGGLSKAG